MSLSVRIAHDFENFALDVRFAIEKPGITALFGPSGAGKTTIVNAIAGLLKPREGRVIVGDDVLLDSQAHLFVSPRARRIGYLFQDARLFPHMDVETNLRFGWRRATERASDAEFQRIVSMLGLEQLLNRRPRNLSGGEKSRVALGRALLSSPRMLLLDEPLAALDTARKSEIMPYLERLRDEAALPMLYVSHALDEVARLADNVIVLKAGKVVAQGSVFDMLADLEAMQSVDAPSYGAVIDTRVKQHREDDALSVLSFDGGELIVPLVKRAIGTRLRIRIRAEDVMLATEEPRTISANNVLLCRVTAVRETSIAHADVQLACGNTPFVARITRASTKRLALAPNVPVFAVIKSVIVDLG
jgi:molybdate transport system ATP-binding protein